MDPPMNNDWMNKAPNHSNDKRPLVGGERPMRVAVLSSTQFGLRCLRDGIQNLPNQRAGSSPNNQGPRGVQVVGILTTPPKIQFARSGKSVDIKTHADFAEIGRQLGCEVALLNTPVRTDDYRHALHHWKPDLLLALGWYYKIPKPVRASAALGCAGIHASLLPRYRGWAPINWAIINGETETGVTFFYLEDEIDAGDVIAQVRFAIAPADTCASVYEKAEQASIAMLREYLPQIAEGVAPRIPQDHHAATQFPQRTPDDGLIDWSWDAKQLANFIRAQTKPYPGAFFYAGKHKVVVWDAAILEIVNDPQQRGAA